ncbi:hypothetical protein [Halostagnicola sp. A-GB9-2]|uniref:hypothetical protein n=1 Tax=Halostagnicola sp. A-GB9-2 TaxID=3048066 RepID=UPI0024C07838|nr:hypothetical protein [Halostagnicola sp. A-GB9-2]MDJ1431180.1 hypothetical protein [Halostagnicola sp. A-GB9-2]
MGRTNPTYRDAIASLESEWGPMRRALRREYQGDFDRLFDRARNFADAAGYANATDPERALLLSLLLAHEVEHRRLCDRLAKTEARLGALESADATREADGIDRTNETLESNASVAPDGSSEETEAREDRS